MLFDTLLHPDADFGYDYPPVLHWKLEQHNYIPHIVLGKGPPGGAWHVSKNFIPLLRELDNFVVWGVFLLPEAVLDSNGNCSFNCSITKAQICCGDEKGRKKLSFICGFVGMTVVLCVFLLVLI